MTESIAIPRTAKEAFHMSVKALSVKWMVKSLNYSKTHIYKMAAYRETNEEQRRDPICILEQIIEGLMNHGFKDLAIAIVDRLAKIVGAKLVFETAEPDKTDIRDELLDDYRVLNKQHEAILQGQPCWFVRHVTSEVIDELYQNLALYERSATPSTPLDLRNKKTRARVKG